MYCLLFFLLLQNVDKYKSNYEFKKYNNYYNYNPNFDFWLLNNTVQSVSQTNQGLLFDVHSLNNLGNYPYDNSDLCLSDKDLIITSTSAQVLDSNGTTWGTAIVFHGNQNNTCNSL